MKPKTNTTPTEPFDVRWERAKQNMDALVSEFNEKNEKQVKQSRAEMKRFFHERDELVMQFNQTSSDLYVYLKSLLTKERADLLRALDTLRYINHDVRNAKREDLRHYRIVLRDAQNILKSKKLRAGWTSTKTGEEMNGDQDLQRFIAVWKVLSKQDRKEIYLRFALFMWQNSYYLSIFWFGAVIGAWLHLQVLKLYDAWHALNLSIEERGLLCAGFVIGLLYLLMIAAGWGEL